jgi:two-component system chemotaxis response regulator CheB
VSARDIIVIGASSGGVEVLTSLVAGLPPDLPAALFIVLHVSPDAPSMLPAILNRAGHLPASHAVDQEPIRLGRVYVAPPGLQTYISRGRMMVRRGPRENGQRPAIDPLFRTAARHYGSRVVGVILSGMLDDGTAGLGDVKQAGGVTVVQDPADAAFPYMPKNALAAVDVDLCVRAEALSHTIISLVNTSAPADNVLPAEVPVETVEESASPELATRPDELGKASHFTCPECNGTLYEVEGEKLRFRCRVGHAYSEQAMNSAQDESVERALWIALRALEERSELLNKLAELALNKGHDSMAESYRGRSREVEENVRAIHNLILTGRGATEAEADDG